MDDEALPRTHHSTETCRDDSRRGDAQKFLTDLWATVCDGTSSAGDGVRPLGPLTEAALGTCFLWPTTHTTRHTTTNQHKTCNAHKHCTAIVTLQLVYRPPAAAVERAVALIQNALELEQAWVDVDGASFFFMSAWPGPLLARRS